MVRQSEAIREARVVVDARPHDGGGFCRDGSTLGEGGAPPVLETVCGGFKRRFELRICQLLKRLDGCSVEGIYTLVAHDVILSLRLMWSLHHGFVPG